MGRSHEDRGAAKELAATLNLASRCTYNVTTASSTNPQLGDTGLPVITTRITLNGSRTTIAGNGSTFRILMVTGSGNLTLQNLTITGGNTPGPGCGIFNEEGTLVLNNTRVTGNTSAGGMMSAGGGIASGTFATGPLGTTVLNRSEVDHNTSSASAGGILNHGGTLVLSSSKVDDNTAAQGGGGIASGTGGMGGAGSSLLVLSSSQVSDNTANGGPGGGILNHGVMTMSFTSVTGNTAPADSAGDQGIGGGIANINLGQVAPGAVNGGILTVVSSKINRNSASGQGGGIFEATITTSGVAAGGPLTLTFSQVTRNQAAQGGGIFAVPGSPVSLLFTTVARNAVGNCAPAIPGCQG